MDERQIPYFLHEADMARQERTIKRLWALTILIFVTLIGTNAAWIIYENQWEDEVVTITQENADGYNNYIGNDGDITNGVGYGEAESGD